MKKAILLALLLLLLPIASAQQSKISTKDADDYRDISVTPEGFQIKDPYALPVYEPKSTSLLPFHEKISSLLNSYLGKLLSNFDVKEAFALRILFEDIEPILSFLGDLLSLPITCIALPFLSLARLIKLPLDILEFLITAILEPIFSIPADEIALLRSFVLSLGNVLSFPLKALKPIEFLVYTPDPLRSLPDSLSLTSSFFTLYSSTLQPLISCVSEAMSCLPLLNVIKVLIDAYLLPILRTPLKLLPLFAPYADDPQVSSLMNLISLPASLPMLALQQLMLFAEDLASVIVLPLLFALRIPLTPLLMLLNFLSHSLEGWKEYVNLTTFYTLIPTLVLVAPVILLALLSFVVSIPLSILLAPMLGIVILLAALLLVLVGLVAMLGAPALILVALAGAVAGGVIGPIAGAIIGIVAAGLLGLIIWALPSISLIPTGVGALAALVLGAIIAIVMLTAGAVIGAVAGGIAGILLGALAALALGILAGSLFALILLAIAGGVVAFLLLSMLLLPALSLFTLPALMIAITLIGTIGGGIVWYLIVAIITGLISSLLAPITASVGSISILLLGALCLVSVISPELFRVLVPPELTAMLGRTISLPTGIARIINGLAHLPFDLMKAIAVLDAPAAMTMDGGGGGGSGNVEYREANFTVNLIVNDEGEPLTEEEQEALQNALQGVEGAYKSSSAVMEGGSYTLKKLSNTTEVSLEIVYLDTGAVALSGAMTAAEAFEVISRLTDENTENDPDMSDWIQLGGDVTETGLKALEAASTVSKGAASLSQAIPYVSTGINVVTGGGEIYEAVEKHQRGEINEYQLYENITATSIDTAVGVVSAWFPVVGAVYYPIDFVLEQTTGKGAGEWAYTTGYTSVETNKIVYTEFVIPAVKEFGYKTGEIWIAEAEAEAKAGEALVSGAERLVAGVAETSLRFYTWLLSLFSLVLMRSLQPEAAI